MVRGFREKREGECIRGIRQSRRGEEVKRVGRNIMKTSGGK